MEAPSSQHSAAPTVLDSDSEAEKAELEAAAETGGETGAGEEIALPDDWDWDPTRRNLQQPRNWRVELMRDLIAHSPPRTRLSAFVLSAPMPLAPEPFDLMEPSSSSSAAASSRPIPPAPSDSHEPDPIMSQDPVAAEATQMPISEMEKSEGPGWWHFKCTGNLTQWIHQPACGRLGLLLQDAASQRCRGNLRWELQSVDELDPEHHVLEILNQGLTSGAAVFKIGISYKPPCRWSFYSDYQSMDYMVVSYISDSSDKVASLERAMIKRCRGDRRCLNKAPGGESAHHGHSPFFLYLVFAGHRPSSERSRSRTR